MNIIIPLGGKGERFQKEGYLDPKPLIKVLNKEIIFYTIDNLCINKDDKVFIIYNKDLELYNFEKVIHDKYPKINLIKLDFQTKGASETIFVGLQNIISNYDYHKKTILIDGDAFYTQNILDKFRKIIDKNAVFYIKNYDKNPIFSYIEMDNENNIITIKEKDKISDNANTGAYAFVDINELLYYSSYVINNNITFNNEPYTSCIISVMLKNKKKFIGIELNENNVNILGTPKQVNEYIDNVKLRSLS
jgi:choline kinase